MQVLAAWSGWLLDGYTTIAYALVGVTISSAFLPAGLGRLGLVVTFAGFAVEALARPIGSLIFGNYLGDRIGRRNMLATTVLGFSIFGGAKGLLPTYSEVGLLAPALLYAFLFIEGMFAGAEYGGGTTLAMESVPPERRAFIGSFIQSGFGVGYFLIAAVFAVLGAAFGPEFQACGWRVLFLTLFIPGALAFLIRRAAYESPAFEGLLRRRAVEKTPLLSMLRESAGTVAVGLLITTGLLFVNTATLSFYPAFMELKKYPNDLVGTYVAVINLASLAGVWIGGALSNAVGGRRRSMLLYGAVFTVAAGPLLYLASVGSAVQLLIAFSIQAFLEAAIFSVLPSFLAESFSERYRATAVGFTYNGGAIVGSTAVSVILSLSGSMGLLPAWAVSIYASLIAMLMGVSLSRETWRPGKD
ncbi:MFS transporter [Thermocladium modestius]|uniref:MFS transporter n=1 Tax=Thermocladium modestius TaxID=62609 RepID=A0A830GUS4_9CREN|nr:MFS transporter [Thermocladium modestius]